MTDDELRMVYAEAKHAFEDANNGDSGIDAGLRAVFEAGARAQWIPCEERMPEGERNVLAAWNKECNGGTGMESMTPAAVRALSRSESDDDDDTFVTHWMPLPAAPLAGKGEG